MTSRNVKSTWELAGRLSSSFTESTKRAQTQLAQMRREYRQNQAELRRMQGVLRTAAQGTDAYANAQRRIPRIQDELNRQAFAIGDLEKEALGGARAQDRLSGATGKANSALRSLTTFGLAAGGAIGVAAGAVAVLTRGLNSTGREAQQLQALSTRGIDTQAYQQAASQLQVLTGDAKSARQAIQSAADASQTFAQRLAFRPDFSPDEIRAVVTLGFEGVQDFANARRDIEGMIGTIREEWAGATEQERLAMRQAAQILGINDSLIDGVAELNGLYAQQADLRRRANEGDLAAAAEIDEVTQRIARVNAGLGVLTQDQIEAAERYSEVAQQLSQAGKDLKNAFVTSFADDFAAAAKEATRFVLQASELWDKIRGQEDKRPAAERVPSAPDWADLLLTGGSGLLSGGEARPLGDFTGEIGKFVDDQIYYGKLLGKDISKLTNTLATFKLPGFAEGGVVPGPQGSPQVAVVHGGERVVSNQDRRAYDQSTMNLTDRRA